jgi:hypothetical protein
MEFLTGIYQLAQGKIQWKAFVNTVMNLRKFLKRLATVNFSRKSMYHGVS